MTARHIFILSLLLSLFTRNTQTLYPISKTDACMAQFLAGALVATAGGFGLSKTRPTLKNRKRLSRKILRAFSVLALLGGGTLSLNAGFALRKHIRDTKKNITRGQKTRAVISSAAIDSASPASSLHNRNDQHDETATIQAGEDGLSTLSYTEPTRSLSDTSGDHHPIPEEVECRDDEVTLDHTEAESMSLLNDQEQKLLNQQKNKLQRLIHTTLAHQYTLHRSGCISDSPDKMTYQIMRPNRENAPGEPAINHYAEYYYTDPKNEFFILKISLYSTSEENPEATYFIIDETHQTTLQAVLKSTESFLRHLKNTSRFKQLGNAATVPLEVCITDSVVAVYENGILEGIERSPHSLPCGAGLEQSWYTGAAAGSLDDGRLYTEAETGAGAFAEATAITQAQTHTWRVDTTDWFNKNSGAGLQKIDLPLTNYLRYQRTFNSKKNTWTHSITETFGDNTPLFSWTSSTAFQVIKPEILAAKILDSIRSPSLSPTSKKLEIASKILQFMPSTLPPLPTSASFVLGRVLKNVSDMYKSFQKIYTDISIHRNDMQAQVKQILDSQLDDKEQLSLILHAPVVLSLLSEEITSETLHDTPHQRLAALMASLRSLTTIGRTTSDSEAMLTLYQKHKHLMAKPTRTEAPQRSFVDLLNEATAKLTMQWNNIKPSYRTSLLTQLNAIFTDPQAQELARTYIQPSEYISLYRLPNHEAQLMYTRLIEKMTSFPLELQKILAPYRAALRGIAANQTAFIPYNPLLELIHSYHSRPTGAKTLLSLLQETPTSPDQKAFEDYFKNALPKESGTLPTWQTLTQAALEVYVRTPLKIAFQEYCFSFYSTTDTEKELLPLLEPLFAHLLRCTQSNSLAEFIASATSLIESFNKTIADNADRFYEILPPELKEAIAMNESNRLQEIKNHCYCIVAETIHAALKPQDDRSGVSIFLNERKDSIIRAIQSNQLTEYILDKIDICTTYLKTKNTSKQNNGLVLCTLQNFGFIKTPIAKAFISKIMRNISNEQTKTSMQVLKKHLIPLYNECVPIINHFIKIIEGRAQQLPITDMQEFMSVVQDALWYFND
jgi:hypothetical protein